MLMFRNTSFSPVTQKRKLSFQKPFSSFKGTTSLILKLFTTSMKKASPSPAPNVSRTKR